MRTKLSITKWLFIAPFVTVNYSSKVVFSVQMSRKWCWLLGMSSMFWQTETSTQVSTHGATLTWNSTPQTGHPTVSSGWQLRSVLASLVALSRIPGITQEQVRAQNENMTAPDLSEWFRNLESWKETETTEMVDFALVCCCVHTFFISVSQETNTLSAHIVMQSTTN